MGSGTATVETPARARRARKAAWRQRIVVATRVLAASAGGYWFAHGCTAFLTLVLPFGKVDRVIAASLLSFAVWCAMAVYVFAVRSTWRAVLVPALGGALLLGVALLFPDLAARP